MFLPARFGIQPPLTDDTLYDAKTGINAHRANQEQFIVTYVEFLPRTKTAASRSSIESAGEPKAGSMR
jgi:hypothetical protein